MKFTIRKTSSIFYNDPVKGVNFKDGFDYDNILICYHGRKEIVLTSDIDIEIFTIINNDLKDACSTYFIKWNEVKAFFEKHNITWEIEDNLQLSEILSKTYKI